MHGIDLPAITPCIATLVSLYIVFCLAFLVWPGQNISVCAPPEKVPSLGFPESLCEAFDRLLNATNLGGTLFTHAWAGHPELATQHTPQDERVGGLMIPSVNAHTK